MAPTLHSSATPTYGAHPNRAAGSDLTDESINRALADFQDRLPDWNRSSYDLADVIRRLRAQLDSLWPRFLERRTPGASVPQPPVLIRLRDLKANTLGHYVPGRNDTGLRWEISINLQYLFDSDIRVASVLLHEGLHCYEDILGTAPKCNGSGYHSAWLRKTAEEIGIPCSRYGKERGVISDSPFMEWAREFGLTGEALLAAKRTTPEPPRKPKRVAWTCECAVEVRVRALVPRGSELYARCGRCSGLFRRC